MPTDSEMGMPIVIYRSTLSISNHVPKCTVLARKWTFFMILVCVNFVSIFSHSFLTLSRFRRFRKMTLDARYTERFHSGTDSNQMEITVLSVTKQHGAFWFRFDFITFRFDCCISLCIRIISMHTFCGIITLVNPLLILGHNHWNDNYFIVEHVDSRTKFFHYFSFRVVCFFLPLFLATILKIAFSQSKTNEMCLDSIRF